MNNNKINAATIYLGSKCNLNCSYCHREVKENEDKVSDRLINQLKKQNVDRIKFMGGEPLLYIKEIKKVVNEFSNKNVEFSLTTNGILLNTYKDYLKKHNFLICVSYDGNNELRQDYDPFTNVLDYNKLSISCTIHNKNTNFYEIIKRFKEKESILNRSLSFYPHVIHVTSEDNRRYGLDKKDIIYIIMQYKEIVTSFIDSYIKYGVINKWYYAIFHMLQLRYYANFSFGETYCVNRNLKKYECNGNMNSCLYIRDDILDYNKWKENQALIIDSKFPRCKNCNVYDMCGAACIKSIEHSIECYFYYNLFSWFKEIYEKYKKELDKLYD